MAVNGRRAHRSDGTDAENGTTCPFLMLLRATRSASGSTVDGGRFDMRPWRLSSVRGTAFVSAALVLLTTNGSTNGPAALRCSVDTVGLLYRELTWKPLTKGTTLRLFDGVHACEESTVTFRASAQFGRRPSPMQWRPAQGKVLGTLKAGMTWVIGAELSDPPPEGVRVDVVDIKGAAIYSSDHNALKRIARAFRNPMNPTVLPKEAFAHQRALLAIGWEVLAPSRVLEAVGHDFGAVWRTHRD